jgi:hypothetical protein
MAAGRGPGCWSRPRRALGGVSPVVLISGHAGTNHQRHAAAIQPGAGSQHPRLPRRPSTGPKTRSTGFQLPGKTGSHSAEWRVAIGSSWVITSGLGSPWAPMGHHGPLSLVPQGPPGLLTDAPGGRGDPMASVQRGAARCAFFSCRAEIKMQEPPRLHTTWAGVPGRPPMSLNLRICKGRVALAPCLIDLPLHPRPLVGWLVREVSW